MREPHRQILGQRHTNGGETVCTTRGCSTCAGRVCVAAFQSCHVPEPEPAPKPRRRFFPTTPEGRARLIGGSLGAAGALYITGAVLRYLQLI